MSAVRLIYEHLCHWASDSPSETNERKKKSISALYLLKQQVNERVKYFTGLAGNYSKTTKEYIRASKKVDLSRCDTSNTLISCLGP